MNAAGVKTLLGQLKTVLSKSEAQPPSVVLADTQGKALAGASTLLEEAEDEAAKKDALVKASALIKAAIAQLGPLAGPPAAKDAPEDVAKRIIRKAELDPYTAMQVTLSACSERIWGARDLLREGKIPEATAEFQGIIQMLEFAAQQGGGGATDPNAAPGTPPAGTPQPGGGGLGESTNATMKRVEMTQSEFGVYALAELKKAVSLPEADGAKELTRILGIAKNFEDKEKVSVEVETAYVPLGGTPLDLTTKGDQKEEEKTTPTPPNDAGNGFSTNGVPVAKQLAALAKGLGIPEVSSRPDPEASDESFEWPSDLTRSLGDDEEKPKVEKREGRTLKAVREPAHEDAWGGDEQKSA